MQEAVGCNTTRTSYIRYSDIYNIPDFMFCLMLYFIIRKELGTNLYIYVHYKNKFKELRDQYDIKIIKSQRT